MCGTCISAAEASTAPMVYAAGFAAVGAAAWSRVKNQFSLRDVERDPDDEAGDHRSADVTTAARTPATSES